MVEISNEEGQKILIILTFVALKIKPPCDIETSDTHPGTEATAVHLLLYLFIRLETVLYVLHF